MFSIFSTENNIEPSALTPATGLLEDYAPVAYGLGSEHLVGGGEIAPSLEDFTLNSTDLEGSYLPGSDPLLSELIEDGYSQTHSQMSGETTSTSIVSGSLDFWDELNPTRWNTYKDDYLLSSGDSTTIQLNLNSSNFDTYLQLIDLETGEVLAYDDDGGISTNSQLTIDVQANQLYTVRVTSYYSFEVGSYDLTAYLSDDSQPVSPDDPPRAFSSVSGYGLVDAASAVAAAVGQSPFDEVADIGGNQWNNDMINAPEVWNQGYTGEGITVAVIDSGVDIFHDDLRDNVWENTGEIFGDGIDNDGNGYVDDRYGWNFGVGQYNSDVHPGTDDPGQDHGTHVAGTIAAGNNGFGMTGVAYDADIMAIRMGDVRTGPSGGLFVNGGDLAEAIYYAVDNGADVINMSLGWGDPDGSVRDALAYAAENNVITVSAAGNSGQASPSSPASYATDYGLSVGASTRQGDVADFSNLAGSDSRMHHVMAPGVDIYSTTVNNSWNFKDGTSMAAPHVAGVVALMLSANPNLTHAQVRDILTGTTSALTASNSAAASQSEPVYSEQAYNVPQAAIAPAIDTMLTQPKRWSGFDISDHVSLRLSQALSRPTSLVDFSYEDSNLSLSNPSSAIAVADFLLAQSARMNAEASDGDDWRYEADSPLVEEDWLIGAIAV